MSLLIELEGIRSGIHARIRCWDIFQMSVLISKSKKIYECFAHSSNGIGCLHCSKDNRVSVFIK